MFDVEKVTAQCVRWVRDFFAENGVKLFFLKTGDVRYRQYRNDFVPDLSIVDVLMFCGKNETKRLLADYTLL